MAKHLLHHATFTGAARKKARHLQIEAEGSCTAAFISNSKPTMMKAEPWDAPGRNLGFPFPGCDGSHGQQPSSSAGHVRRDHGINSDRRSSEGPNQMFTTVPYYDGHEWRKYGEKNISGLDFPRCYYRCTYSPCPAKKRVEQVGHEYPPMYLVTYQKEHTCNVSTREANTMTAAAAAAPVLNTETPFSPFAPEVGFNADQKHFPSTPSTITEASCVGTCSRLNQPNLQEHQILKTMEMVDYDKLTSFLACALPDLPILPDLVELEPVEFSNYLDSSISPSTCLSLDQAHSSDLATLGSIDMVSMDDALDLACAGDMHGFLAGELASICFDSSCFDVLDQLEFDDEDALNPLWSW